MTDTLSPETLENAGIAHGLYRDGEAIADTKAPKVEVQDRWRTRQFEAALVNPANRRKLTVIVVGSGLAGGAASATLGEAGYNVKTFCYQDSPRRAHSIAAQGGINAAKNYKEDGDSVYRLFYDTVKGVTSAPASPTSTASPRSAPASSTSASRRVCPSPASTAACSTTARSVACRSRAPSTPAARRASSC